MKNSYFVGGTACLCVALAAFADAEMLTVAQGETVDRGSAYKNWYNSALTVSGTLNVFTGGNYYLCAVSGHGREGAPWHADAAIDAGGYPRRRESRRLEGLRGW